jgi:hypothetical protein
MPRRRKPRLSARQDAERHYRGAAWVLTTQRKARAYLKLKEAVKKVLESGGARAMPI